MRARMLDALLLVIAFGIALGWRLAYTVDFDGLYGQDSYAYYDFALDLPRAASEGRIASPAYWTLGYPALLTAVFAVFGESAAVGQAVNIVMGAALSPLVYGLVRLAGGARIGAFAAALIMALCGQAIQSSIVLMTDIPALFWATASAAALLAYLRRRHVRWLMLMAACLALAILTRPPFALLGLAWGVTLISTRANGRHIIVVGIVGALMLLPQAAYNALSPLPSLNIAPLSGWHPANALASSFVSAEGAVSYPQINAVYYAQFLHAP
ncbi:MAG: glycosyltransferase family 39 protein, partial [Chloroflexota bacterium]|nr:glycosyltransferase family 39 protein [Chloroflexota bacterium]